RATPASRLSAAVTPSIVFVASANAPLHLQLDESVQLDGVLQRQLLRDRLDEAAHDHRRRLVLAETATHEVEELLLADLRDRRLVPDVRRVLLDLDVRERVRARRVVDQKRVALDVRLRARRTLVDLDQPTVRGAARPLRDRLRDDLRR